MNEMEKLGSLQLTMLIWEKAKVVKVLLKLVSGLADHALGSWSLSTGSQVAPMTLEKVS